MKKNIRLKFILFVASVFAAPAAAAAEAGEVWTLEDCMAYAVQHNFDARSKLIDQDDYRRDYTARLAAHFPSLSAGASTGISFGRNVDPETNTYETRSSLSNYYGIDMGWTLFNGFAMVNYTRAAKLGKLMGVHEQQQVEDRIALQTMQAYITAVYADGLVGLAREQLEEQQELLRQVRRESDLGLKSPADVAQIEADIAGAEFSLIKSENELQTALLKLKDQMNYPVDHSLRIESDMQIAQVAEEGQTVDEIFETALETLPGIKVAEFVLDRSKLNYKASKAALYPSLRFGAGISTNYYTGLGGAAQKNQMPYFRALDSNLGESMSVSMSIPIFSSLNNRMNMYRYRNNVQRSKVELERTTREARSEIEQAVMDLNNSLKEYMQAGKKVAATELAYKVTRRKFEEGLFTAIDVQTSYNSLLLSKIEYLNSRLIYVGKCRQVNYYKGIPLVSF